MSILPDVELEVLTTQVLDALETVIEDNPNMTEEEAVDWIYEIVDSYTPIWDYDVLMLAANNLSLIGLLNIPQGILGDTTPVEVARAAVFEYLKQILYAEWHGRLKSEKEEE